MERLKGQNRGELQIRAGFVLLLVACALATFATISSERADSWVAHTLHVRETLIKLYSDVRDAETGQRGFLLTQDPHYLEPYIRARSDIAATQSRLSSLISDNAEQTALLSKLNPLVDRKLGELQQTIQLSTQGNHDVALSVVRTNVGHRLMENIQALTQQMDRNESALLDQRLVAARHTRLVLLVATFLSVLLACVLAYRVRREATARQKAIEEKNHALEEQIQQRETAEMRLRQVQKMEALGQLTGGIAHDFNNMLAIIAGNLEMALRHMTRSDDALKEVVSRALNAAMRGADLTKRLLAFSRMQPLRPKSIDANDCVRSMLMILQRTLGEDITIDTALAPGLWRVFIDRPQLESALLNLAVNSRDAMKNSGRLTIETSNTYLDQTFADSHVEVASGHYVMVAVTDTGGGMAPDVIQRAFDPFFTTKEPGQGTGLGLSQVHGFIKQSRGHVQIYSELGIGTTVKMYLPRTSAQQDAEAFTENMVFALNTSKKVLVVEDDDEVRRFVVACITELGYMAIPAESANIAQQKLATYPDISLLLTDVIMPGKNGRQLVDTVRPFYPKLRVLYMTGYPRDAITHNGILDDNVRLITKPFSMQELARELRYAFAEEVV
ncbi:CHASE3 domain-containing protein [Dyella nitratireducens]|uniref:histidine kinase n=1 Tax=Dyella nitratireducens TaxID=1849580 RepID=A0ABQ1FKG1_9GAMM|nr:CHASE3 domain-containing protein [Dyella nitratireducens]GGA20001.1 histidine kinase [Dyella nitratireducens]GLQ44436.1 histidine kinase [Dyella nitratireducens]